MVPDHNREGLIPPFDAANPTSHYRSPYPTTWDEAIERFATSPHRMQILLGLLDYRDALRGTGFLDGHQWLTGSFVEAIEREPNDVDVVNFLHVPFVSIPATAMPLFRSQDTKATYHCDAYTIPLSYPSGHSVTPEQLATSLVDQVSYWYGLFSHRRGTYAWKGFVQLPLGSGEDDVEARAKLLALLSGLQRKAG